MKVLKFGGTSVGSAAKMRKITEIIQSETPVFVVLSAMSGVTNQLTRLIALAKNGKRQEAMQGIARLRESHLKTAAQLDLKNRETRLYIETITHGLKRNLEHLPGRQAENKILSSGEKLSTFLFHQLLLQENLPATLLDATALITLNENHEPDTTLLDKKMQELQRNHPETRIFITQGFICRNHKGETDNLGRGGSDYSASLFGAALQAGEIQIWTDIDGVQNNDPRLVENTRPIRHLRFEEAAELAYFGAKILHPLTILPAQRANIPVWLKNTMHPEDPGTLITANHEGKGFKAVAARDGITAIRIRSSRMLLAYGFMRKVFEVFETYKTPIDMVTTSEVAVSITIDDTTYLPEIVKALEDFGTVEVEGNKTIVGVVGLIQAHDPGYAHQLFEALNDIPIRMISYGASRYNFSLLVNTQDKERTLRALNSKLFHNEDNQETEKQAVDYSARM